LRRLFISGFGQLEEFVVVALNEKWERDFGERKRWQKHTLFNPASQKNYRWYDCPYCGQLAGENGLTNYCPNCGKPLDPPDPPEET
jgi:rubrerythrin